MGMFRKLFITGEIDLYDALFQNKIAKKAESGLLNFADLATKKISDKVADIKTDLYLSGVIDTMPKITMEQISKVDAAVTGVENSIETLSPSNDKQEPSEISTEEQFDNFQNTRVVRRKNSRTRENDKPQTDYLYRKKSVCLDIENAIDKGFKEALETSKMTRFNYNITKKKAGYRFDYISIDFEDPTDEEYFIKKHNFILKRIGKYLSPKQDKRGQKVKRNLYFNSVNRKLISSYNGYTLAIEKIESSIMDRRNYYHLLSPNSLEFVVEVNGEPRVFDMAKSPHPLIMGTTGAGKSAMQNSMISSFIENNTKDSLSLELISPKLDADGNDFTKFSNSELLTAPVLTPIGKEIEEFLEEVVQYCERAVQLMKMRELQISKGIAPSAYHILAIDEIVDVVAIQAGSKKANKLRNKIIYLLNAIAMKGRSSKVHLFLATQSPRADYIGAIKSNLNFISLKVSNSIEAKVSGFLEADELLGRGDGFLNIDGELVRFQSPM